MLQSLSIRDFVIVDTLDIELSKGFTVLTGETGAGKSILIDALSLAIGARGEGGITRAGAEKAEISASFHIAQLTELKAWLQDNEIPNEDDELLCRRVIYADGRSRAFINGQAATIQQLREAGEWLVDIYSQNAHHSLLKLNTQKEIFDAYCGLTDLASQTASQYKAWQKLYQRRLEVEQNATKYADELAELRDKVRELKQLSFSQEEWDHLQQEHSRLSNGAALLAGCEQSRDLISENEMSALRQLAVAQHKLQSLRDFDASLDEGVAILDSAIIQLEETNRFLNRYLQRSELDPERLAEVESRIQSIHATSRKYRLKPEGIVEELAALELRMAELDGMGGDGELAKQEAAAEQAYQFLAKQLTTGRTQSAPLLSQKITAEMQRLSLAGGRFEVALTGQAPAANGLEQVEFLVAGHVGVEPRALSKVASGGELSRISLAIRVVTAAQGSVPTMIFDEVDVGIGGGVAEIVGQLLKQLGSDRQVLVITHLPQVAAQGKQHLNVKKVQRDQTTLSTIEILDQGARIEEIARMLGGVEITETTRQHAKEMLSA
jgi:DNA repair protein RecN (Recombination protein N)